MGRRFLFCSNSPENEIPVQIISPALAWQAWQKRPSCRHQQRIPRLNLGDLGLTYSFDYSNTKRPGFTLLLY
jgi:hypothetical protein